MDGIRELFDLEQTMAKEYLSGFERPWDALPGIGGLILKLGEALPKEEYEERGPKVWVHVTAQVAPTAVLEGPCIIGRFTEVRPGALVRGNVLVGEGCVIGNASELRNVILFNGVQVSRFNYVCDSILGCRSFMGAGAGVDSIRPGCKALVANTPEGEANTGLKRVGVFLGDFAEIGYNSVAGPAAVIGRGSVIEPLCLVRGTVPARTIVHSVGRIELKRHEEEGTQAESEE